MNQRFVEAFYWVATLKSMTRAAEKLFMTQSAISSRVSALEEELGTLLIDRRDRQQFALTNAGMRFLDYAERLMAIHRQMRDELGTEPPAATSLTSRTGASARATISDHAVPTTSGRTPSTTGCPVTLTE